MSLKVTGDRTRTRDEDAHKGKETRLYLCKVDIFLPETELATTRKHLAKILVHLDPGWKFIRIRENENTSGLEATFLDENSNGDGPRDSIETGAQALAVVLFLNEAKYEEALGTILNETDVWQLRHTIKLLNNVDKTTVIGSMDFYELSPDLPLWAISPLHVGNQIIRFNIFVNDFEKMRDYYEKLIVQKCNFIRKGFCKFNVHSYAGLEVEISLKTHALGSKLRLTRSAVLRLKFRKLDVARCHLVSPLEQVKCQVWRTQDPEGNVILLEEAGNESRVRMTKRRSKSEATKDELVFV